MNYVLRSGISFLIIGVYTFILDYYSKNVGNGNGFISTASLFIGVLMVFDGISGKKMANNFKKFVKGFLRYDTKV